MSHGQTAAVPTEAKFYEGDIRDRALLRSILPGFEAVLHFAAFIEAGESMNDPEKYFENNVNGSQVLIAEMVRAGITKMVFSSTAAVYRSQDEPLTEESVIEPVNVYGQTKRMIEETIHWYHRTKDLKAVIFRYFNAAGASLITTNPERGEAHEPESHIIPNILKVALGQKPEFILFGNNYPTQDGTCIRDYIHVDDLATAHLLALEALSQNRLDYDVFNLGNGSGFTNLEVVSTAREVTGHEIPLRIDPPRTGDAAKLVASSEKARRMLNWQPQYPGLKQIMDSAWAWHQSHPKGYES